MVSALQEAVRQLTALITQLEEENELLRLATQGKLRPAAPWLTQDLMDAAPVCVRQHVHFLQNCGVDEQTAWTQTASVVLRSPMDAPRDIRLYAARLRVARDAYVARLRAVSR